MARGNVWLVVLKPRSSPIRRGPQKWSEMVVLNKRWLSENLGEPCLRGSKALLSLPLVVANSAMSISSRQQTCVRKLKAPRSALNRRGPIKWDKVVVLNTIWKFNDEAKYHYLRRQQKKRSRSSGSSEEFFVVRRRRSVRSPTTRRIWS